MVKNLSANEGNISNTGLIPGSQRSPGGGHEYRVKEPEPQEKIRHMHVPLHTHTHTHTHTTNLKHPLAKFPDSIEANNV